MRISLVLPLLSTETFIAIGDMDSVGRPSDDVTIRVSQS